MESLGSGLSKEAVGILTLIAPRDLPGLAVFLLSLSYCWSLQRQKLPLGILY